MDVVALAAAAAEAVAVARMERAVFEALEEDIAVV